MDSIFNSPTKIAHKYWQELLQPSDIVIDATLGNGQDALFLSQICGTLIGIDIQKQAIDSAKELITSENVSYVQASHETFPEYIEKHSIKLIVYNLGYLPRGDKSIVTKTETTLQSLKNALELILPGGMISVMCYSGHEEGAKEELAVLDFASRLPPKEWCACHTRWLNRHRCPSLLLLSKCFS